MPFSKLINQNHDTLNCYFYYSTKSEKHQYDYVDYEEAPPRRGKDYCCNLDTHSFQRGSACISFFTELHSETHHQGQSLARLIFDVSIG